MGKTFDVHYFNADNGDVVYIPQSEKAKEFFDDFYYGTDGAYSFTRPHSERKFHKEGFTYLEIDDPNDTYLASVEFKSTTIKDGLLCKTYMDIYSDGTVDVKRLLLVPNHAAQPMGYEFLRSFKGNSVWKQIIPIRASSLFTMTSAAAEVYAKCGVSPESLME